jgi:hypothetical protein
MGIVEEGQHSCVRFADFMLLPDESLLPVRLPRITVATLPAE